MTRWITLDGTDQSIEVKVGEAIIFNEPNVVLNINGYPRELTTDASKSGILVGPNDKYYQTTKGRIDLTVTGSTVQEQLESFINIEKAPTEYLTRQGSPSGGSGGGNGYTKAEVDSKLNAKADKSALDSKADKGEAYTKLESDNKFALKGEGGSPVDAYTKAESDGKFASKISTYTKLESDNKFALKGDSYLKSETYSKTESDNKFQLKGDYATKTELNGKADKSELTSKADKSSVYLKTETLSTSQINDKFTETETSINWLTDKTFGVVNVKEYGAKGDGIADDSVPIQKAFDVASTKGSVTVYIPAGTYRIKNYMNVYSNTHLIMSPNAVLLRGHTGGLIRNGKAGDMFKGYEGNSNILIEGGVLDGNVLEFGANGFNHTGWAHGTNITFRGITFKDNLNAHCMDLNACKDVLVENCRFLGYKDITPDASRSFSEAIQISNHTQGGFSDFGEYDSLPTIGVVIRDCYFGASGTPGMGAYATGAGNHVAVHDYYNQDIKITGCTFDGMTYAGVRAYKFKNFIVSNNTFLRCERGIVCSNTDGNGESSKDPNDVQTGIPQGGDSYVITGNIFRDTNKNVLYVVAWEKDGIIGKQKNLIVSDNDFGNQVASNDNAIYLSFLENVKFTNNIIGESSRAMHIKYVSNIEVVGNTFGKTTNEHIYLLEEDPYKDKGYTSDINIRGNTLYDSGRTSIYVQYANGFRVEGNTVYRPCNETDATRNAITASSGSKNGFITGNKVVKSTSGNMNKFGIEVTGSCVNVQVGDNDVEGKTGRVSVATTGGFSGFHVFDASGAMRKVTVDGAGVLVVSPVV